MNNKIGFVVIFAALVAILTGLFAPAQAQQHAASTSIANIQQAVNDRVLQGTPIKNGVDLRISDYSTRDESLAFNQRTQQLMQEKINILTGGVLFAILLAVVACLIPAINARHSVPTTDASSDTLEEEAAATIPVAAETPTPEPTTEPISAPIPNSPLTAADLRLVVEALLELHAHSTAGNGNPIVIENHNHFHVDGNGFSMSPPSNGNGRRNRNRGGRRRGQQPMNSSSQNNGRPIQSARG